MQFCGGREGWEGSGKGGRAGVCDDEGGAWMRERDKTLDGAGLSINRDEPESSGSMDSGFGRGSGPGFERIC